MALPGFLRYPPAILDVLEDENSKLRDALEFDPILRYFRLGREEVKDYVLKRSDELLEIAIYCENELIAKKAITMITDSKSMDLIIKMTNSQSFLDQIDKIFNNHTIDDIDKYKVSKYGRMFRTFMAKCPDLFVDKMHLLKVFLKFIEIPMMITIFDAIAVDPHVASVLHDSIMKEGVVEYILNHLEQISTFDQNRIYYSRRVEHIVGLHRVLVLLGHNDSFERDIYCTNVIDHVMRKYEFTPLVVRNSQYKTLYAMYRDWNTNDIIKYVDDILQLFTFSEEDAAFHHYHESGLKILKQLESSPEVHNKFSNFGTIFKEILEKFKQNSVAKGAIISFITGISDHPDLAKDLIKVVLDYINSIMSDGKGSARDRAFLFKFSEEMSACEKLSDIFSTALIEYPNLKDKIEWFEDVSQKEYGGPVPVPKKPKLNDALSKLIQLSQEDMNKFIRTLTI